MNKIKELENVNFRLIYAFYLDNESKTLNDHISNRIHLKCLKYILHDQNIASQFKEIYFIIHTLNLDNPLIKILKQKLANITNTCKHVHFIIEKNMPEYREGIIFKKYVLDKLDDYDGMTLFFHNKGYNKKNYFKNKDQYPSYWIISLYFFNMYIINFYEYFSKFIYNDNKLIWGFPLIYLKISEKFSYHIAGSCYWMKCKEIYNYLNDNEYKINKVNENVHLSIFNCAEMFFPHTLNIDQFDYYESNIIKNIFNDYVVFWMNNTNESTKTYFEHTLPYYDCKILFDFYDYIMEDIENYEV